MTWILSGIRECGDECSPSYSPLQRRKRGAQQTYTLNTPLLHSRGGYIENIHQNFQRVSFNSSVADAYSDGLRCPQATGTANGLIPGQAGHTASSHPQYYHSATVTKATHTKKWFINQLLTGGRRPGNTSIKCNPCNHCGSQGLECP